MSSSRHPVALDIERQVGRGGRLLATVMGLPLVDGIFPVLVLAGALTTWTGMLEVGLLVFGGSAMVAVVLAEMDGTPRQQAKAVLLIGAVYLPGLKSVLETTAPGLAGWGLVLLFSLLPVAVGMTVRALNPDRTAGVRAGHTGCRSPT